MFALNIAIWGWEKPIFGVQPPWLSWHCCACSWSSKCRMVPRITWHIQFDVLPISHTFAYGKSLKHILTVITRNRLLQKRSLPSWFLREYAVCHPQAIRPAAGWVVSTPRQNADPEAGLSVLALNQHWLGMIWRSLAVIWYAIYIYLRHSKSKTAWSFALNSENKCEFEASPNSNTVS